MSLGVPKNRGEREEVVAELLERRRGDAPHKARSLAVQLAAQPAVQPALRLAVQLAL